MSIDKLNELLDRKDVTLSNYVPSDIDINKNTRFIEYTILKRKITLIDDLRDKIILIINKYSHIVAKDGLSQLIGNVNEITKQTSVIIHGIKTRLNELTNDMRICEKQIHEYTWWLLKNSAKSFNQSINEFRRLITNSDKRHLKICLPNADDAILENIVNKGLTHAVVEASINEDISANLDSTIAQIEQRHSQIIHLEQTVLELNQLFVDLSIFIDHQGETLDSIAEHVNNATEYIVSAEDSLVVSDNIQKTTQNRLIYICCLLGIFAVIGITAGVLFSNT